MGKFDDCLFVSDMDATLLTSDHKITPENRAAIDYFISEGGHFTVATGRIIKAVGLYLDQMRINAPAILHNGAKIYDFAAEKTVFEKFIEEDRKQIVKQVYKDMPELGLEICADDETIYIYRRCEETNRFKTKKYDVVYDMPDEVWEKPWIKVLLIGDSKEILDRYEPIYRSGYDSGYCVRSGPLYLDIVAGGVSKGRGVTEVARTLGKKNIITIGDSPNDIEMLQAADISFAVANAVPDIKNAALFSAPHHNDSAVAYAINKTEQLILN